MDPLTDFFSTLNLGDVSATALLGVAIILILTGRLQPKSVGDAWKDAYFKEKESGVEKEKQITELTAAAKVSARVLDALPYRGGDPSVDEDTEPVRGRQ